MSERRHPSGGGLDPRAGAVARGFRGRDGRGSRGFDRRIFAEDAGSL
jgi:hypothetical protein